MAKVSSKAAEAAHDNRIVFLATVVALFVVAILNMGHDYLGWPVVNHHGAMIAIASTGCVWAVCGFRWAFYSFFAKAAA